MRTIFCLFKNKWQWGKVGHSYNPSTSEKEKESGGSRYIRYTGNSESVLATWDFV